MVGGIYILLFCNTEWGAKQAAQLTIELEASLAKFDVTVGNSISFF